MGRESTDTEGMALSRTAVFGPTDSSYSGALTHLADALEAPESSDRPTSSSDLAALPADARAAIAHVSRLLAAGLAISVGGVEHLLSTSQAAELLGVSATYTIRFADEGALPVEYVGSHRRFRLKDVVALAEERAKNPPVAAAKTAAATAARRRGKGQ